jgi:hypothetical protein
MGRSIQFALSIGVAICLAGCGTADFKQPIAEFKKSTDQASDGFKVLADALDKEAYDQNVSDFVDGKTDLTIPSCESPDKCVLVVAQHDPTGKQPDRMIALKPNIVANARKLMLAIVTYVNALNDIASSDDAAQIKTAGDAIPGAVTGLAGAVEALNTAMKRPTVFKTGIAAVATPAADILTIGLIKYAEYEKLNALRDATSMSEHVFPAAMDVFSALDSDQSRYVRLAAMLQKNDAADKLEAIVKKIRVLDAAKPKQPASAKSEDNASDDKRKQETTNQAKTKEQEEAEKKKEDAWQEYQTKRAALLIEKRQATDSLQSAVETYRIALAAKPGSAFAKLADAHTALTEALNSPHPDFKAVFAFVQQAADAAAQIAKDAKAIDDALRRKAKA